MHWSIKIFSLAIAAVSCTIKPEAIRYGRDGCDFCRMTIMNPAFGGEIVTGKGKTYKFDGVECLVNYYKAHAGEAGNFTTILVADYSNSGKMLDARRSFFLKDEKIESPMGAHLAALPSAEAARRSGADHPIVTSWDGLLSSSY